MVSPDEGSSLSASSGNDPPEHDLAEREETYGPLRFRRYVKGDGRALILYTQGESAQGSLAQGSLAQDSPAQESPTPDGSAQDSSAQDGPARE